MNKLVILGAVMLTAGLVTLPTLENSPTPAPISNEVTEFDEVTTNKLVNYRCFKDSLESALAALEKGEASIAEATARVHRAARTFCPVYLNRLQVAESGRTPTERVARNLVGHVLSRLEGNAKMAGRLAALRIELEGFVRDIDAAATE